MGFEKMFLVVLRHTDTAAILINGLWPSVQFFEPPLTEESTWFEESWPRGFRGEVVDGRQMNTKAHPEPSAQVS